MFSTATFPDPVAVGSQPPSGGQRPIDIDILRQEWRRIYALYCDRDLRAESRMLDRQLAMMPDRGRHDPQARQINLLRHEILSELLTEHGTR